MITNNIIYDYPAAGFLVFGSLLFLFLPWLYWRYKKNILRLFWPENRLEKPFGMYVSQVIALALGWFFLVLALMGPKGNPRYPASSILEKPSREQHNLEVRRKAHEFIFMVDTSNSMKVKDGRSGESRLEFAKDIADELVSRFQGETGSLYTFTSAVTQDVPATMDYFFLRLMLRNIQYNEGDLSGTDIQKALHFFHEHYLAKPSTDLKTLVLLSDGGDNQFDLLPDDQKSEWIEKTIQTVKNAAPAHLRIISIGLGTKEGGIIPDLVYEGKPVQSSLQDQILKRLSLEGQGRYYEANQSSSRDLAKQIFDFLSQDDPYITNEKIQSSLESQTLIYDDYFQYPLIVAIILFLYGCFSPETLVRKRSLLLMFLLSQSFVMAVEDFHQWDGSMRQARMYYEAGEYSSAETLYQNLLGFSLPQDQKALITYNLALALAAQKKEDASVKLITPWLDSEEISLYQKSQLNLLAFSLTLQKIKGLFNKKDLHLQDLEQMKALNKKAASQAQTIQNTLCHLEKYEGYSTCFLSQKTVHLSARAKEYYSILTEKFYNALPENLTLEEGVALMTEGLEKTNLALQAREKNVKDTDNLYLIRQIQSWDLILEALQNIVKTTPSINQAEISIQLDDFIKHFKKTETEFSKDQLSEAKASLAEAQKSFIQLAQTIWKGNSLLNFLTFLSLRYEVGSVDQIETIQSSQFLRDAIFKELNQEEGKQDEMEKEWEELKKSFQQALKFHQLGKKKIAAFFYEEALSRLNLWKIEIDPQYPDYEKSLLKMIETVHFLQVLPPEILIVLLPKTNENLTRLVQIFYSQVKQAQNQRFEEGECQFHPWNEVIPNVEKGMGQMNLGQLETTVEFWDKAYQQLKAPKSNQSCHQNAVGQQSAANPSQESQAAFENQLEVLQQMENEDRQEKPVKVIQEGVRPW